MENRFQALLAGLVLGAAIVYLFMPIAKAPGPAGSGPATETSAGNGEGRVAAGDTLARVRSRGELVCGVNEGLPGFSNPDDKGHWSGIDVDYCRALASAIFDDPTKVKFRPLNAKDRFTALQSGEIDVLSRNTTWTMSRDTQLGLDFAGVDYYDGQGFMVYKDSGIEKAEDLDGATICTQTGTTTELNVADYFRSRGFKYNVLSYEKNDEALAAYQSHRCDAYTTDASGLAAVRLKMKNPAAHRILPEIISKEPLGPAVRQGDPQWADIARWTLFALINAEELGVTSENVEEMKKSDSPRVRRLLGEESAFGPGIGLTQDWVVRIIRHVGNYGEIFERNVGKNTPLGIERGLNALWNKGGIMYAPPIR